MTNPEQTMREYEVTITVPFKCQTKAQAKRLERDMRAVVAAWWQVSPRTKWLRSTTNEGWRDA